jgi:hypothetical protein
MLVQLIRHSNHSDLKPLNNYKHDIKFTWHNDILKMNI